MPKMKTHKGASDIQVREKSVDAGRVQVTSLSQNHRTRNDDFERVRWLIQVT